MLGFLDFLLGQSDQWDVLSIASVAKDSSVYNLLTATGGLIRIGTQSTSPYIPLPGNWETYLKTVSKKLRRNLKYFRSNLEGNYPGTVDFVCVIDTQELNSAIKKLEELNRSRWHAKKVSTAFDDPAYSSFHKPLQSGV